MFWLHIRREFNKNHKNIVFNSINNLPKRASLRCEYPTSLIFQLIYNFLTVKLMFVWLIQQYVVLEQIKSNNFSR